MMSVWQRRYPILRQVIINTKTDKSFRGALWARRRDYLVLCNAEMLRPRGETTALDGDVVIMADNVDFIQVVG